ncbi:hypothetical protein [Alteribacter aurantiacus]|uniref:hypothetical protein n=1 Tax=Alteribacter aurantiacus TaxID=254410 RepID=UPI00041BB715|nr:hypothetical protein [Alteribacter aurantiacus]
MKEIFKSLIKSGFLWLLMIPIILAYGTLSVVTYQLIEITADKLEEMEPEIIEAKESGERLPFKERNAYESTYNLYYKSQNLIQSFWMKYFFTFPKFTEPQ